MTEQIPDTFLFGGDEYFHIGKRGGDLFSPGQFGVKAVMIHTACYRGFYATYELTKEALFLREFTAGNYVPIKGIKPEVEGNQFTYSGLSVLVPFTGMIRIAKDPIGGELCSCFEVGFLRSLNFKTVLDIYLKDGRLVDISDRSLEWKRKRNAINKYSKSGNKAKAIEASDEAYGLDIGLE